jgi:hypothetical protein
MEDVADKPDRKQPREFIIFVCPDDSCIYLSMQPGQCRSHPYPCRAMGPLLEKIRVIEEA